MEIVTPQPTQDDLWADNWTLLTDGDATYLHVTVEMSFVTISRMIKLDETDLDERRLLGWIYLHYLARRVHYARENCRPRGHRSVSGGRRISHQASNRLSSRSTSAGQ